MDRPNMTLPYTQQLLYVAVAKAVKMSGAKLILVIVSEGAAGSSRPCANISITL